MTRDNIKLRKYAVPKKLTLANGRTFYAKYEIIKRGNLPPNIRVARRRKIGPRRQITQKGGRMVNNLLKSGINIGSKLFRSALGQKIIQEGIEQTPNIYKTGVNKISNEKIKKNTRIRFSKLRSKASTK